MEWVMVTYPRVRDVFVDGRRSGRTNRLLVVGRGTHEFHLGEPVDYAPRRRTLAVAGTSAGVPLDVDFRPA
jgi:hypothetical protein